MTENETTKSTRGQGKSTRVDWELHHTMIHDSFLRLFKRLQRPPSQHEIASDCGLSRTTIQRHVKKTGITDFAPNFKLRAERVLHGITNSAEEGNVAAARLYFELVFGWNPDANDNGDRDFKVKVTFE